MTYGGKDWDGLKKKDIDVLSDIFTKLHKSTAEIIGKIKT
jgi:hypothetical protein